MPIFAYRARTAAGRAEHGIVDAESLRAAWHTLRARGVFPTDLAPNERRSAGRVDAVDLVAATRELASLVAAGLPVAEALEGLADDAATPAVRDAMTVVGARLREGVPLAEALAACPDVFPPLYRDVVRAGEASGALGAVLDRLAHDGAAALARRARVRAALVYPAVMLSTTSLVLGFLLVWVVPQVTRLFAETGTPLPLATRLLIGGTSALRATWWLWALAAVLGGVAGVRWIATPAGRARVDDALLRLPIAGRLVAALAMGRVARTVSMLIGHGVPLDQGLLLAAATTGNATVARAVARVREDVLQGGALAPALRTYDVLPSSLCRLVATGERTGTLATAFAQVADAADARVERALATATSLVEPLLVVVMGGAVLLLVLAILVPILTLDPLGAHR